MDRAACHVTPGNRWLGEEPPRMDTTGARAALVRRYLRLYGPSTADDLAAWAGVSPAYARRIWAAVGRELLEVEYAGRTCHLLASDEKALARAGPPAGIRLVPPYDPYLQQRDRATAVPDTAASTRLEGDRQPRGRAPRR